MSPLARLRRSLTFARKGTSDPNDTTPDDKLIDEEKLPEYEKTLYYPAAVGDTLHGRYLLVGKLEYGPASTIWLALDNA